jgi:hypothetical protein
MVIMNCMSKNKRKGHDDTDASFSRSVVFSPRNTTSSNWTDCKGRLDSILQQCSCSQNDPVLDDISEISTLRGKRFPEILQSKLEKGDVVHQKLQSQIAATNLHLRDESAAATSLREQWQKLVRHADFIQQQKLASEQQCAKLASEKAPFQKLANQEREIMELTRQQRAKQVPRLQQQISLYAAMTGIKWDFEAQEHAGEYLVGEVVGRIAALLLLVACYKVE